MISYCNLNTDLSWKFLPWIKINTRILLLQKKIFAAAKECNYKKIYRIQNYLINCNEAKLIAIEYIINKINNSYSQKKYYCTNKEKIYIFKLIFSIPSEIKYLKNRIIFFIENIKQYLIYLCLEPEWRAKFEPYLKNDLDIFNEYTLQCNKYFINEVYKKNIIDILNFNQKNLNLDNTIYKIQSLPYINISIKYWITNKYLINNDSFVLLKNLLYRINFIGLEWYQFKINKLNIDNTYLKSSQLYYHYLYFKDIDRYCKNFIFGLYSINSNSSINYIKYIIIQKEMYNKILLHIKYILYKKNKLNKLRSQTSLTVNKVKNIILKEIKLYCLRYYIIINKNIIKKLLKIINIMIYYWYINKYNKSIKTMFQINKDTMFIFLYNQIIAKKIYYYSLKINR